MKYSIREIETDIVNYKLDDSYGEPMITLKICGGFKDEQLTASVNMLQELIKEIPEAIRVLTQDDIESVSD